jgi:hypothetical protein
MVIPTDGRLSTHYSHTHCSEESLQATEAAVQVHGSRTGTDGKLTAPEVSPRLACDDGQPGRHVRKSHWGNIMHRRISHLGRWFVAGLGFASVMGIMPVRAQEMCGGATYPFPYTDVSGVGAAFCPGIMEAYVTGVSKGTSPTTFSPDETVSRVQMTTFLQRSLDQSETRTSRRAAIKQWWTTQTTNAMQTISVGGFPAYCALDSESVWASTAGSVVQVKASTGAVLGTWTVAGAGADVLVAAGKVFVAGNASPGNLYVIDPTQAPGAATLAASSLGDFPNGIAFDGANIWTANYGGSVSIITPQAPYTVSTVTTGFSRPYGILYDGAHIWVADQFADALFKLDASGNITQTGTVGANPQKPVFDGTNIWVPNFNSNSITVVQASSGNVVGTIAADVTNQLSGPVGASFDGERVLVTNFSNSTVSVFKAADLSFIANVTTGVSTSPEGACSDGINFWVTLFAAGNLLRF